MELTGVRFESFKSLYDLSCTLDHMTVLTGPNGSGKSNFVDALNFLGEVYQHGLEIAVSRSGGYENIAHRRTRRAKRPISITVEVLLDKSDLQDRRFGIYRPSDLQPIPNDFELIYRHSFSFKTSGQGVRSDFEVTDEVLELIDQAGKQVFRQTRVEGKTETWVSNGRSNHLKLVRELVAPFGDKRYADFVNDRKLSPTTLLTEQTLFANLFSTVARAISGIRIFQLSPHQCRASGVPTPNASLERHGENLPGAADHLRRNDPAAWKRIQTAMRSILPDLVSIDIAYTEDRRLALQFRETGIGRPWSTGEVSDGTIQALALFIALFDTRSSMIVIEEPENSVHPWILRQFLDLCGESRGKQLLLTSHSPVLLNYVAPSIVRLTSMRDGRTEVRRVTDMSLEVTQLALSGELSLFDAYDSGVLPESVPRGFQSLDGPD